MSNPNLAENLTRIISQITTMEKENEELKEENKKLLNGFDTDTHTLVEKAEIGDLADKLDAVIGDVDSVANYCEKVEDEMSNAKYYADEVSSNAQRVYDAMERLLKPKKEETKKSD